MYEENNALRYTAGYIPKALEKQLKRSAHPLKEKLITRLEELVLSDLTQDFSPDSSTDWINLIDQGGLVHINEMLYLMMQHMELELRSHLKSENIKENATKAILHNEEVLFYWDLISGMWEDKEREALLQMITEQWITIRGFSYASAWMESHKQMMKRYTKIKKCTEKAD